VRKPSDAKVADVVFTTLKDDFAKLHIIEVKVLDRTKYEDDDIVKIEIIFDGKPSDLDARKVSGAVRQVRPRLTEIGEEAFPLFSFVSKGDSKQFEAA
jgi:hypothetical protein